MAVKLSALCSGFFLPPGTFLVLIYITGLVYTRAIVKLEGSGKLKDSVTSSTIECTALQLIA
jgi:hypothetical protein